MITRRLYDIAADDAALEELMLDAGGEITPEAEALIAEHLANLEGKSDTYAGMIAEWDADAKKFMEEAARLAYNAKCRQNASARLKARLCEAMGMMGRDKIVGARFTVARQANPRGVQVLVEVDELPEWMVRVIPESREADKKGILAKMKELGVDVMDAGGLEVARLTDPSFHLRIR